MDIANRLDLSMKAAGFKDQTQLARASGVNASTINRILSARIKAVSAEHAAKLAAACKVDVNWLILGHSDPNQTDTYSAMLINSQEREIIQQYRSLSKQGREIIFASLQSRLRDEIR
ncbi:helix-turn-helix domain-containing protein [Undibacterium curvum]|uniref:helix-turn-helix domain-containing protein n=1 Tax=Undibacterium curvum TaxID=2762294 RepID=UPI003D0F0BE0